MIFPHTFQIFFTTKSPGKGTGLSLSISWNTIVRKHGGALSLACPSEGETVFTIMLPLQINPAQGEGEAEIKNE